MRKKDSTTEPKTKVSRAKKQEESKKTATAVNELPEVGEQVGEELDILTPAEYFEKLKSGITEETPENIQNLYNTTMKMLKRYITTGQAILAKAMYARCAYLEKEIKVLEAGVTKYVERTVIDKYIDEIADECVCVVEMKNFEREIPEEIIDKVFEVKDLFDQFYVVFTDYTGEKRSKVAKERRDKDPILFGNIFIDGKVSPKMYFIGDWVDEYCDLTLDKIIEDYAKKDKDTQVVYDIKDNKTLEEFEKALKSL